MAKIRELTNEEYNSYQQFMPPNPFGHEVSVGREMEGGDDEDMEMGLQAMIPSGVNPIPAYPIQEARIDVKMGNELIPKILQKLGDYGHPRFVGEGEDGLAFEVGNKIYKLTDSISEVNDSIKIKGKRNAHLADIYGVYKVTNTDGIYVIVQEKLRVDTKTLARLEDNTVTILNAVFGVKRQRLANWALVLNAYKNNRQQYDDFYKDKIDLEMARNPQERFYFDSLLNIIDELNANGIKSMDIVYVNLGYKQNGNIGFFDLGKGDEYTPSDIDQLKLQEEIFERVISSMPNSTAVAVKKKCQLGGNGDGTSEPCNQGDINALVLKTIKECLDESIDATVDPVGKEFWFEYHCNESCASPDAPAWYRSHQKVQVLKMVEPGVGETPQERGENGEPRVYKVRFQDGLEWDVFEDELMNSPDEFYRPNPPKPKFDQKGNPIKTQNEELDGFHRQDAAGDLAMMTDFHTGGPDCAADANGLVGMCGRSQCPTMAHMLRKERT